MNGCEACDELAVVALCCPDCDECWLPVHETCPSCNTDGMDYIRVSDAPACSDCAAPKTERQMWQWPRTKGRSL